MSSSSYLVIAIACLVGSYIIVQNAECKPLAMAFQTEGFLNQNNTTFLSDKASDIFLFAVDGRRKPYSYENEDGKLVGFDLDVISAVCGLVNKICHVVLAEFTECIFTDRNIDYAGRGLMSGWFQGCPGYQITTDRKSEFEFTLPYLEGVSTFTVLPGNPKHFNPNQSDLSSFSLVHLTGAPTNAACLTRLNKTFETLLVAQNLPEAKEMLSNGTADVLFSPRTKIDGLEVLPGNFRCDEGQGAGVMLKKGSTVPTWWNPAFKTLYLSGVYTELCQSVQQKYGSPAMCLPPPENPREKPMLTMYKTKLNTKQDKLWTFVVSGRIAPFSFLNHQGELVGFTKDLISSVCEIAEKRCALLLAEVHECSHHVGQLLYPGRGLIAGWFDACTGYFNTVDRSNSWDFTSPYLLSNASFYVAPGNPTKFNDSSDDYSGFVIAYAATAITNSHCLHRLKKKFDKLIEVADERAAIHTILSGKADAWFTKRVGVASLERLAGRFHCENVGTSIMVRKGSRLPTWWNPAFQFFYETGGYNDFCQSQGKMYQYNFPCIPLVSSRNNSATSSNPGTSTLPRNGNGTKLLFSLP